RPPRRMGYTGRSMPLHRSPLGEVVAVFARLGVTAFGGPAAHVALQEQEFVRRRGWLDHERFLDMLAMTNLIPGPNSTEMAMHLVRLRAGMPGLVAGGGAFLPPPPGLVAWAGAAHAPAGPRPPLAAALRPAPAPAAGGV